MNGWSVLDAELIDTLQHEAMLRGQEPRFRTVETKASYPLPSSRATPVLICAYCGRRRCVEHRDLPRLDPYFNG